MNPEQQIAFDNCYAQLKQNLTGLVESYKTNSANQILHSRSEHETYVSRNLPTNLVSSSGLRSSEALCAESSKSLTDTKELAGFDLSWSVFHTMLITMIVKQVETCGLKGADKKSIAIELGRKLIVEIIEDTDRVCECKTTEAAVITMYDMFAPSFIDQLVDVASNVNVRVRDQTEVAKTNPPDADHKDLDNSKSPVVAPKACCVLM